MRLAPFTSAAVATRTREALGGVQRPCATAPAAADDKSSDPRAHPDLREPSPMSVSSKESQPPIELTDMRCPTPDRNQFRRPDGRQITRDMPCNRKTCPACGPRLQRELVAELVHAMGSDQVYRKVVHNGEPAKLRRRKSMAGKELWHTPLPDGKRAVYTTAPVGEQVTGQLLAESLTSDVAADPNDGRRHSKLTDGWAQVVADARAEREAKREPWEWLGRVGRSLEHVELVARDLGTFVARTPVMVVVERMDPQTTAQFLHLIRCRGPWQQWVAVEERAA